MSAGSENHPNKRQRINIENQEEGSGTPSPKIATNQATVNDAFVKIDMTQRYLLTVEYVGTTFLGWQKQQGGRTVQGQLEDAIHKFVGRELQVFGSSRTDTGVHALGNTCHLDIQRQSKRNPDQQMPAFEPSVVKTALNHFLQCGKGDVAVCDVRCIPSHFHARFQATQRTYHYRIDCANEQSSIFERHRAWHVKGPLNLVAMRDACRLLEGHHDFSSFRGAGCQATSPLRTLTELHVMEAPCWPLFPSRRQRHLDRKHGTAGGGGSAGGDTTEVWEEGVEEGGGGSYVVTARAPSFLYHQVRLLVGLLKSVGCGAHTPSDDMDIMGTQVCIPQEFVTSRFGLVEETAKRILEARDICLMPAMAPAHGLYLAKVHYDSPSVQLHKGAEDETRVD